MQESKMKFETPDLVSSNIDRIGEMFPNCLTEAVGSDGKPKKAINFEVLKQMLSSEIVDGDEAYEFTWVGKKSSIVEANRPTRKTLRPCPEESVDWDTTENLYIEGDNLEVLKLLQESYLGKVKMIYIDPPYNTGNDFVYADDFVRSQDEENRQMGMYDEEENRLFKNTDSNGRFHSDWCTMIYPRLLLARNLLSDDGVIFISIDDNEYDSLKKICDEVFGRDNFLANLIWQSTPGSNTGYDIKTVTEYILMYSRVRSCCTLAVQDISDSEKYTNKDEYYERRGGYILNKLDRRMTGHHYSEALNYAITVPNGEVLYAGGQSVKQEHWNWRWSASKVQWGIENGFIVFKQNENGWSVYFKQYEKVNNEDVEIQRALPFQNLLNIDGVNSARGTREVMDIFDGKVFDYPKPLNLIKYLVKMIKDKDCIILDFFSGSATTAHAVMSANADDGGKRKFILVQLPERTDENSESYKEGYHNICEIGKERIRRAGTKEGIRRAGMEIQADNDKWKNVPVMLTEEHQTALEEMMPDVKNPRLMGDVSKEIDTGFRVLKLDESNMNEVYYAAEDYSQDLVEMMEDNIKADRTELDLLFGCLVDWGVPLSLPYESRVIDGCTVHNYNDGELVACFAENVPESVVREMAKMQPIRAVFRDSSFADSPSKINVFEIFKYYSENTNVRVI